MKAHDEVPNAEQARAAILLGGPNTAQHRTLGAGGGGGGSALGSRSGSLQVTDTTERFMQASSSATSRLGGTSAIGSGFGGLCSLPAALGLRCLPQAPRGPTGA